jgi:hypothetical protein
MSVEIFTWNTGRAYTASGQRMAAKVMADGRMAFVDVDRGIDGLTVDPVEEGSLVQKFVVTEYDYNRYKMFPVWESEAMFQLRVDLVAAALEVPPWLG